RQQRGARCDPPAGVNHRDYRTTAARIATQNRVLVAAFRIGYARVMKPLAASTALALLASVLAAPAAEPKSPTPDEVLSGLKEFFAKNAKSDGSFRPGVDPKYEGISDSAYSDVAPVVYAVVIHKTFGWKLPDEEKT